MKPWQQAMSCAQCSREREPYLLDRDRVCQDCTNANREQSAREGGYFWAHVAKVLADGDEARMKAAQDEVYAAFAGRERIGPRWPVNTVGDACGLRREP